MFLGYRGTRITARAFLPLLGVAFLFAFFQIANQEATQYWVAFSEAKKASISILVDFHLVKNTSAKEQSDATHVY